MAFLRVVPSRRRRGGRIRGRFSWSGRFRGGASRREAAAAACYQRWRGASGAGADSVMSVGFSSSAIFVQVLDSWELSMSAAAARRTAPLDRWELQLSQASACRNSEYLRA